MMKKLFIVLFFLTAALSFSQQKFALVIGNGNYVNTTKLNNPVNDANDMAAVLQGLGFSVDKVLNGTQDQMVNAVMQLKRRLSASRNSYGFLFYAGHGVQSGGENYLVPVDANIPSENFLRNRTVSVQEMLDELNDAGNEFNVVVLDACRDNPFSWKRSGSRGLSVVGQQPADSILVFATAAGSTAADGNGRNGLFTSHLLDNLKQPGLEVTEVFRRTGADVARASGNQQRPAVYNQFYGTAYLGGKPQTAAAQPQQPAPQPTPAPAPTIQPAAKPENSAPNATYKIGDKGPAGGIVFYDKGNNSDGWRYMEAAPVDSGFVEWGLNGKKIIETETEIGCGKRNTELIIAALIQAGEGGKAAQLCRDYTLNGYNDWFLPSKDELDLMCNNLKKKGLGDFRKEDKVKFTHEYWSSSGGSNGGAWYQNFGHEYYQNIHSRNTKFSVRAVRTF